MKEIRDIVKAYEAAAAAGKRTALATVVHVEGSSYRRPGARMLVTEDGQLTGAISGGCLEGDALKKAQLAIFQQKNKLVTYDTTDEDDIQFGVQLGCNGVVHILFEPVHATAANPVQLLKEVLKERQNAVLTTLFSFQHANGPHPGTCLLYLQNGQSFNNGLPAALQPALQDDVQTVLKNAASSIRTYNHENIQLTAFIAYLQPAIQLVIAGAGNDVMPLVAMADILGWQTIVADGRPTHATAQRFPQAQQVLNAKPAQVLQQLQVDAQTVFVLMTHNYNYDAEMLGLLLPLDVAYIGMLGPRKKRDRMLDELHEKGYVFEAPQLEKIFGPVGLDIGAETAEEIAMAIVSEIKAVLAGKSGKSLRQKINPIHNRTGTNINPEPGQKEDFTCAISQNTIK